MSLSTQTQGFDPEQKLLRSKRIQSWSKVTEDLHPHTNGKGNGTKGFPEFQTMIAFRGLDELRETCRIFAPVELPTVNNNSRNCSAMAANPFGGTVYNNISTVLDGTAEISTSSKSVVNLCNPHVSGEFFSRVLFRTMLSTYHQWYTLFMSDSCDGFKVGYIIPRVSDRFNVDGLRTVINGCGYVLWAVSLDKFGFDPETRKENFELVISATIQVTGGHDVVANMSKGGDSHELRGLAGRGCDSCGTTFKGSNTLLEDIDRRLQGAGARLVPSSDPQPRERWGIHS